MPSPTGQSMPWPGPRLHRLVLWNPVLDLRRTIHEPEPPRSPADFGPEALAELARDG